MRKTFYAKEKKYVILHPTFFILSIFIIYQRRKFTIITSKPTFFILCILITYQRRKFTLITSKPKIVFDPLLSTIKNLI